MSCRTPGGPASPESYWSLLERGGDGVGPLPGRWSRDLLKRLDEITGGLSQEGGFIDAVEEFVAKKLTDPSGVPAGIIAAFART